MKKTKSLDLYLGILFFAALIAISLRTYALFTSFNSITMHFDGSFSIIIANILVTISVVLFFCYLFLGKKDENLIAKNDNAASYIPAGLVSIALLFMGVNMLRGISLVKIDVLRSLSIVGAALAFLSVGSFFLSIFIEKRQDVYKAAFSLSIVFFLAVYSCYLFFNKQVHPTNSPNKLVDQMAYVFSATFFLYETRIPLARAKWRGYVSFGLSAALLCFYSSVPSLIVYAVNRYQVSDSFVESILTLALAIFIFSKVLQTRKLTKDEKCDVVANVEALAAIRQEEIENQKKLARAHNSNNEEKDATRDVENYTFDIPYIDNSQDINVTDGDIDITQLPYTE
jgi:hypothetical protein